MQNKDLIVSSKMAFVMGLFLPVAETVRRINQLSDPREFISWFDDYLLGAVLIWAAYLVYKEAKNAVAYLIAAWGVVTGALFLSFLGQFNYYHTPTGDPGIFSTTFVAVAKGIILLFMFIGLTKAIRANLEDH